jgi:hypothetical protein
MSARPIDVSAILFNVFLGRKCYNENLIDTCGITKIEISDVYIACLNIA